nr:type II toxin-antitoxin system VapB family antitoxin [Mesorhizobium sp. LNHC220B00]
MNLQIRDPRARELAQRLAAKRKISMTEAVIEALESELKRESGRAPLARRLAAIADRSKPELARAAGPYTRMRSMKCGATPDVCRHSAVVAILSLKGDVASGATASR